MNLRFLRVHVETKGAAVDLGGSNIDKVQNGLLDGAFLDFVAEAHQALKEVGR
ncbi:hypothetical protein D3C80_2242920 [compost metagenome]